MSRMARPRFQFRLSTVLRITLAAACWFGGMRTERSLSDRAEVIDIEHRLNLSERIHQSDSRLPGPVYNSRKLPKNR